MPAKLPRISDSEKWKQGPRLLKSRAKPVEETIGRYVSVDPVTRCWVWHGPIKTRKDGTRVPQMQHPRTGTSTSARAVVFAHFLGEFRGRLEQTCTGADTCVNPMHCAPKSRVACSKGHWYVINKHGKATCPWCETEKWAKLTPEERKQKREKATKMAAEYDRRARARFQAAKERWAQALHREVFPERYPQPQAEPPKPTTIPLSRMALLV